MRLRAPPPQRALSRRLASHFYIIHLRDTSVVCHESGQTKFPFSYLEQVTLLTLAQVRLSTC